jgi:SPP1 gp7 family putative phage head morphogenesis protein
MGKKQFAIATRYDRALAKEEDATIARVNTQLEQAFSSINGDLTTYYENLQGEGSLTAQMRVRRSEELKTVLTRIDPSRGAQYEREFEQLITTATQTGRTLGDELLTSYQSDLVGQFTNIPYQAIAAQARDGAIRLSKHTEAFQDKASAVIEMGLVQGKSSKWMQRELRNQLGVTKSKAESIARTESASAFNSAAQARYKAGGVDGIQVMTTPSDRVCPFCAARNGNVYKHGAIAVPFHVRCRCILLPWSPDWQRLGLTDDEFVKDYREKGLKDLRSLGLQPDYGLAPFERANKVKTVPVAMWKPGDAVLETTRKRTATRKRTQQQETITTTTTTQQQEQVQEQVVEQQRQVIVPEIPQTQVTAKLPGAKKAETIVEQKLPQIKDQREFSRYLRAHVVDIDETYNKGGMVSLADLEQRMSLHGVKPDKFKSWLLDSYDDTFSLGNNDRNPAYLVNGLERNTLSVINRAKFPNDYRVAEIEAWHKSLKGKVSGEVIDSLEGFRAAAGDFVDKAAGTNGNFTEIYKVRQHLGDRVTRREFNTWLSELQFDDSVQLMGGSLTNASPENLADSIRGANGGARFYIKKNVLSIPLNPLKVAKAAPDPDAPLIKKYSDKIAAQRIPYKKLKEKLATKGRVSAEARKAVLKEIEEFRVSASSELARNLTDLKTEITENLAKKPKTAVAVLKHGMTESENLVKVRFGGIDIYATSFTDNSDVVNSLSRFISDGWFPENLRKETDEIIFSSQRNKEDDYWAKKYNSTNFVSAATGGDRSVVVYNARGINHESMAHEMGHNLAFARYGTTTPNASTTAFGKLAKHTKAPTQYGGNSVAEDFAESVQLYVRHTNGSAAADAVEFKSKYPKRYELIQNMIDDPGYVDDQGEYNKMVKKLTKEGLI